MKRLIIGPGGMLLYMFLGALKVLDEKGMLADVEEISCASCGSILGFFYILTNGDIDKMVDIALEHDMSDMVNINIKRLVKKFGLMNPRNIVPKLLKSSDNWDPTFQELYDAHPIKLYISTYDAVMQKTTYMSVETTPNMKVTDAIVRSISIPFIFSPEIEDDEHMYLDGSVCEPTPYAPFIGKTDVFEISYKNKNEPLKIPVNLLQFFRLIIISFLFHRIEYKEFPRIVVVPLNNLDVYDFKMSREKKLLLFRSGYEQSIISLV